MSENYLENFDGYIDMDLLSKFFVDMVNKEYEQDPMIDNFIIIDIHSAFSLSKTIQQMYVFIMSTGVLFNKYKPDAVTNDKLASYSPVYGKIRLTVPTESELMIRFNDKEEYKPLVKEQSAKMVKRLFLDVIDKCLLRFPHEPLSESVISVQYREGTINIIPKVTLSDFNKRISMADSAVESSDSMTSLLKDVREHASDGDIDILLNRMNRINMLEWYGIHFEIDAEKKKVLAIHVPKSSSYQAPGTTLSYCGRIAYEDGMSTLRELGMIANNEYVEMIEDDVHWDSARFNDAYEKINNFSNVISDFLRNQ